MINLFIPLFIIFVIIYSTYKKNDPYASFINGAKSSLSLILDIFPYIIAMFLAIELFRASGFSNIVCNILSPVFGYFNIPSELTEFIIIRPFSGNSGLVMLREIFSNYGVDSYLGRCASVIMGSSDTVFYVVSIYFSRTSVKRTLLTLPIALLCSLSSAFLACWLCTFM